MRQTLFRSQRTSASDDGFTIVELTVTVSIFAIVIAALLGIFISVQRSQAYVTDRSESMDGLRIAMDRVSKEVRQATAVTSQSTTAISMTTFVGGSAEALTWSVSGGELRRTDEWGLTQIVLRDVTNTDVFTYTPATGPPLVVAVRLEMRPAQSPNILLELTSEIRLRNG